MNKYCIYKKSDGDIEVWKYIEDIEEVESIWYIRDAIEKYGEENILPICMNKAGCYHQCYKPECIAIIESNVWPSMSTHPELFTTMINKNGFNCGWIDPLGNTYHCHYMEHASLAAELVLMFYAEEYTNSSLVKQHINSPDDFLLTKGWIRVNGLGADEYFCCDKYVSKEALKKLIELRSK